MNKGLCKGLKFWGTKEKLTKVMEDGRKEKGGIYVQVIIPWGRSLNKKTMRENFDCTDFTNT